MNVTQLKDFTDKCTGCCACSNSCPVGAIDMLPDIEGFSYPNISKDSCIDCGLCVKNCHITNLKKEKHKLLAVYYGRATRDEDLMDGSSGGVFPALANKLFSEEAIVFGACFEQTGKVIHQSSLNTDIKSLFRSKYVQSDIGLAYTNIEKFLKNKKTVLFCGTPCQVQGLYTFLNCNYEQLYTTDFICHGVPSPGIFKDMLEYYAAKFDCTSIPSIEFRAKTNGWRNLTIDIYDDSNIKHSYNRKKHPYYYSFLHNYSLRKSCFTCDFTDYHASDLTIADYWKYKDKDDDKGMSLVMVNTKKGEELLRSSSSLIHLTPLEFSSIVDLFQKRDKQRYSLKKRGIFFKRYTKYGYIKTMNRIIQREIKVKSGFLSIKKIVKKIINSNNGS